MYKEELILTVIGTVDPLDRDPLSLEEEDWNIGPLVEAHLPHRGEIEF